MIDSDAKGTSVHIFNSNFCVLVDGAHPERHDGVTHWSVGHRLPRHPEAAQVQPDGSDRVPERHGLQGDQQRLRQRQAR